MDRQHPLHTFSEMHARFIIEGSQLMHVKPPMVYSPRAFAIWLRRLRVWGIEPVNNNANQGE